ncbi:8661_t:CDS:2 [Entrophospora sp. SA101]|nr:8661_t:CDS:2 [Entrophospora sp. SA101]
MPIDYSKWDRLELSDDDEIECHPNVDKASLIRWKQADIHAKREERRQKIASLKQQISLNDVLLSRIDDMIVKLKKEGEVEGEDAWKQIRGGLGEIPILASEQRLLEEVEKDEKGDDANISESKTSTINNSSRRVLADGTYATETIFSSNSSNLARLEALKSATKPPIRGDFFLGSVLASTLTKLVMRYSENSNDQKKINSLRAEAMLIMASVIRVGQSQFVTNPIDEDSYDRILSCLHVLEQFSNDLAIKNIFLQDTKASFTRIVEAEEKRSAAKKAKDKVTNKIQVDELITFRQFSKRNLGEETDENKSTTTKKDVDEEESGDIEVTELAKQFAEIKDYKMSYEFITKHPEVVSQEMTDQILAEAFQAQLKGKAKLAKQCAHQGWLLQYCQRLGKDGVRLFFERINGPNPQAREIFMNDVNETYNHIRERCKIIAAEKTQKPQPSSRQAEQIQIEVTGPNSSLNVRVPDENSTDKNEQDKYKIFTTLPKNLQEALKTGEITKINEVLGEMSVEEAEDALKICGDADVLSIEEGIIDTTKGEVVPNQEITADNENDNDKKLG